MHLGQASIEVILVSKEFESSLGLQFRFGAGDETGGQMLRYKIPGNLCS